MPSRSKRSALRVRKARRSDLPALDRLYAMLHEGEYRQYAPGMARMRKGFDTLIADDSLLVAEMNGGIVGTLHVHIFRWLGHGVRPSAIIEDVVGDEACRSRGIVAHLMKAAEAIARRHRCYKLSLTSNVERTQAHRFYQRLGWSNSHKGFTLRLE